MPDTPWAKIAADIFEFQGRSFLLIVDYFSKYPEVLKLSDKTSGTVIAKFKGVFARHGIPTELIADHVPFASAETAQFARKWGFKITHSSPAYPQSNGLAERTIQSVKNMLKATSQTGIDPHMALLHFRSQALNSHRLNCRWGVFFVPISLPARQPWLLRYQRMSSRVSGGSSFAKSTAMTRRHRPFLPLWRERECA